MGAAALGQLPRNEEQVTNAKKQKGRVPVQVELQMICLSLCSRPTLMICRQSSFVGLGLHLIQRLLSQMTVNSVISITSALQIQNLES